MANALGVEIVVYALFTPCDGDLSVIDDFKRINTYALMELLITHVRLKLIAIQCPAITTRKFGVGLGNSQKLFQRTPYD